MSINTLALAEEVVGPDEAAVVAQFVEFLKATSTRHHPTGTVPRFNQGRAAGCVEAELIVPDGLPQDLRVGLFAQPGTYKARIRFANATSQSDKDRDVRGMSIKVLGVGGGNLTPGVSDHDFVLNSHPVMMVGHTKTFLDLLKAVEQGGAGEGLFFVTHPHAAAVALASRQHPTSHLEIPYWSTTPYLFGPGRAVKSSVRPTPAADAAARSADRHLPARPAHDASLTRGSHVRPSRPVSDRQPQDADRRCERRMARARFRRFDRSPHPHSGPASRRG